MFVFVLLQSIWGNCEVLNVFLKNILRDTPIIYIFPTWSVLSDLSHLHLLYDL
jgi:hypothetical protein